jgi:hypothetical protein
MRPFHEAMHRWARRTQHIWQVFGLAGAHHAGAPSGRRFPVIKTSACDGGRSCIPLRDSPGFSPGSLSHQAVASTWRSMWRALRSPQTSCAVQTTFLDRAVGTRRCAHCDHSPCSSCPLRQLRIVPITWRGGERCSRTQMRWPQDGSGGSAAQAGDVASNSPVEDDCARSPAACVSGSPPGGHRLRPERFRRQPRGPRCRPWAR